MSGKLELKCAVVGCSKRKKNGDTICSMHRARVSRTGRLDLKTIKERLMERVSKDSSGCWNYTKYLDKYGYGRLRSNGKKILAHRLSWEIHRGEIGGGLLVCHTCDNPSCVNPDHLFLGTDKDNVNDAISKGRINPKQRAHERWRKCPALRKQL